MYFVNLCEDDGLGTFRASNDIPFENTKTGTVEGYITLKNKKLVVDTQGKNLFENGIIDSDEPYLSNQKTELKCKDLIETEENPLIIVLCDYIEVFDKVPANLKFIHLGDEDDKVLAMLIHGACSFNGIPMQRCYSVDVEGKKSKILRNSDLKGITHSKDKESGYNFIDDAVIQIEIKYTHSSSGACLGGRMYASGNENFNPEKLEHYREHMKVIEEKRKRKKAQEELEKQLSRIKAEEYRQQEEAKRKAEEEKRKADLEKALAKKEGKKNATKKAEQEKEVSVGAKGFLAALGIE